MPDRDLVRVRTAWEELRPLLLLGPCRACECLHGLLAELRLTLEELPATAEQDALLGAVRGVRRPGELHACLGCQPCGPGTLLADFYRADARTNT